MRSNLASGLDLMNLPVRGAGPQLTAVKARQAIRNAAFSGTSGAEGLGDRGAWQGVPTYSGNPYDSNDYIYRWRQLVHLYETSWEARKIINIPVDDALRKPWKAEGIPEGIEKGIQARLKQLHFSQVLKRSLKLERLLGGCLTFFGLEGREEDVGRKYHPHQGARLRFCNPIPISRIQRVSWDSNPLSEHYMRPKKYMINGQNLHVSRALVWDGEPLFDPMDFALTNFRSNLAGFGPSVLSPIWDDIVKAVGTRQAAYQMIQVNNAIIAAIGDLQDLMGNEPGKKVVETVKQIANQLSVFRAAVIDKDNVQLSQHSASFGSVPELIITFIQILSAASDIPATRFIGQAPGGLNATGESDLENYYNVIDAYQEQRIEPALRRTYDVVGYEMYPRLWEKEREKLTFKFPPLWNLSELEEADKRTKDLDNIMKGWEAGLMTDEHAIEELNAKQVFSVKLTNDDISVVDDSGFGDGGGTPGGPGAGPGGGGSASPSGGPARGAPGAARSPEEEIQRLRNSVQVPRGYLENAHPEHPDGWHMGLIEQAGADPSAFDMDQFRKGYVVEQEHADVTEGDEVKTAKIVLAHLTERADYYTRLERIENGFALPGVTEVWREAPYYIVHRETPGDFVLSRNGFPKKSGRTKEELVRWYEENLKDEQFHNVLDTHGRNGPGWYGVDLDGTLAQYDGWKGSKDIGPPVPAMLERVRRWLEEGREVRILTARAHPDKADWEDSVRAIRAWCREHLGRELAITHEKDPEMLELWDDRAVQVEPNTGRRVDGIKNKGPVDFKEADHPRADDGKFGSGGSKAKPEKKGGRTAPPAQKMTTEEAYVKSMEGKSPEQRKAFDTAKSRGLRVPPAWADVWVNPDANGELQVKGKDEKGRTQYIYSAAHTEAADAKKFARLKAFAKAKSGIMARVEDDLASSEEAKVLYLINLTGFRVGGEADTGAEVQAYGASTLTSDHVSVDGSKVSFNFVGKKGVKQSHVVDDPRLAEMVTGKEGRLFDTDDGKVRKYLKKLGAFKPKDFRTYVATDTALGLVKGMEPPKTRQEKAKLILQVATQVAKKLGNTPVMARDSYIDPAVFKRWEVSE